MNKPVLSTYRILMKKALDDFIDESWVDWAIEMMRAGFESDNLYMLAGILRPYDQIELQQLTDNVLKDLELNFTDKETTISNYACFIIKNSIASPDTYLQTLQELSDIYLNLDMASRYQDFYLLHWAKDDLIVSEHQWYWDGANRTNINDIIRKCFQEFLDEFEAN